VQTNCLCNFDNCFLFFVVVAIVVVVVVASTFAFALAFVLFVSIFVSFVSFALSFAFFSPIVILFAFVIFLDFFLDRNIKRICESKKIKIKLTIYNSNLMLLLRICFRIHFIRCVLFNS